MSRSEVWCFVALRLALNQSVSTAIPLGETRLVSIITTQEKKRDLTCKVVVTTASRKFVQLTVKKVSDGYTCDFKPTEEGLHSVEVTYDNKPAQGSPFNVQVTGKGPRVTVTGLDSRKLKFHFVLLNNSFVFLENLYCWNCCIDFCKCWWTIEHIWTNTTILWQLSKSVKWDLLKSSPSLCQRKMHLAKSLVQAPWVKL